MHRLFAAGMLLAGAVGFAGAQTTGTTAIPAAGSVGGTPGSWVEAAIARHQAILQQWFGGQPFDPNDPNNTGTGTTNDLTGLTTGSANGTLPGSTTTGTTTTPNTALASLAGLLGQYGLGGLVSGTTTGTTGTSTLGTTGTTTGLGTTTAGTTATGTLGSAAGTFATTGTISTPGTEAKFPIASVQQNSSQSGGGSSDFLSQLQDALVQTFFDSLSTELQSQAFADLLRTAFQALILPANTPPASGSGGTAG